MPYYNPAHAEVSPAHPTEIYFACICFDLPWNVMRVNLAFNVWDKPNILPWIFEQSRSDAQCLVTRYVYFLYATLTIGKKRKKENTFSNILNHYGRALGYFLVHFYRYPQFRKVRIMLLTVKLKPK